MQEQEAGTCVHTPAIIGQDLYFPRKLHTYIYVLFTNKIKISRISTQTNSETVTWDRNLYTSLYTKI
jgi:hypothetical protein